MEKSSENFCNTCPPDIRGLCCHQKRIIHLDKYHWGIEYHSPCEYLNKAGRCRIYDKRHEIMGKKCLTIEEAKKRLWTLPFGCKYLEV